MSIKADIVRAFKKYKKETFNIYLQCEQYCVYMYMQYNHVYNLSVYGCFENCTSLIRDNPYFLIGGLGVNYVKTHEIKKRKLT